MVRQSPPRAASARLNSSVCVRLPEPSTPSMTMSFPDAAMRGMNLPAGPRNHKAPPAWRQGMKRLRRVLLRVGGHDYLLHATSVVYDIVVESRRHQLDGDGHARLVLPEPAVDSGLRRNERAVRLALSQLIVFFVADVVVFTRVRRFDVRLGVKLIE